MKLRLPALFVSALLGFSRTLAADDSLPAAKPASGALRALLITSGCCHDYPTQTKLLTAGVASLAKVDWTIENGGGSGTRGQLALYDNPDWAKAYDVIVHNECFADTDDADYIKKITTAHKAGKPAVVVHCAMHTHRAARSDDWREFLGVTSRRHDHVSRYVVRPLEAAHPALIGFPERWTTPPDELYVIEKLWPGAKALAVSTSEKDGKAYPVIWVNDYHGTRVFGTSFGHGVATWEDPVFITLLARGLLWAAERGN